MKERLLAALLTVLVFAAGLGSGIWSERHRPLPPPPGGFLGEFGPREHRMPVDRAHFLEDVEKLRPQIEAFQLRMAQIYAQFDQGMDEILTPDQKKLYDKTVKSHHETAFAPEVGALTDERARRLLERPIHSMTFIVVTSVTLDVMTKKLNLDEAQRAKVRDLLRVRRDKFIELVDNMPPPSLQLSQLAPMAQRLAPAPGN